MEFFPAPLENLVEQFARLPGIGSKSAQRLAFHVLNLPQDQARAFADAILEAKRSVTLCPVCQNLTSGGLCPICASPKRDDTTICVVADPRDVVAIERSREYNGRYHVLHGVLSPMNHVGPDDLQIKSLVDRVAQGGIQEVIMATNPDTEGGDHRHVLGKALKALRGKGYPPGLRHPRGGAPGICRRRHADACPGRQAGAMKRACCAVLAALLLCLSGCGVQSEPEQLSLFAMDTYMTLAAYGDKASEALAACGQELNRLDGALSRTREGSEIYTLNAQGRADVSQETADLISAALTLSQATGGAFDPTVAPLVTLWGITTDSPRVPQQTEIDALLPLVGTEHVTLEGTRVTLDAGCAMDLGGIAKGYASDRLADIFAQYGVDSALVSLGGNVYTRGTKPGGAAWSVAVQHPEQEGYAAMLSLTDAFAVTSGGYQRYFTGPDGTVYQHILDPKTGWPVQGGPAVRHHCGG